jgi:Flp pilus assembly protein TadG
MPMDPAPRLHSRTLRSRIARRITRTERGAAAVEFAIILPVLVLVTFGIIEYSSAYHDESLTADAARAGARVGSSMATDSGMPAAVVAAVNSAVSTMPSDAPQELWIYKANNAGYPGNGTSFSSCSTNCLKYTWSQGSKSFTGGSGSWSMSTNQVCTMPYDQVGVYVKVNHPFITGMFGSAMTLTDHAVFRFEPVASSACSS